MATMIYTLKIREV